MASPTPSGHGFHSKVDTTVNESWEIGCSMISFPNTTEVNFEHKIFPFIQATILNQQGIDVKAIEAKIHLTRMILYRSGSHYTMQKNVAQVSGE